MVSWSSHTWPYRQSTEVKMEMVHIVSDTVKSEVGECKDLGEF